MDMAIFEMVEESKK